YILKLNGNLRRSFSFFKGHHHKHFSREGRIHRVKRYGLNDSYQRCEFKESSLKAVLPLRSFTACLLRGWRIEQRHSISTTEPAIELIDLSGHFSRRKPDSQCRRVSKCLIESFTRSLDDFRISCTTIRRCTRHTCIIVLDCTDLIFYLRGVATPEFIPAFQCGTS